VSVLGLAVQPVTIVHRSRETGDDASYGDDRLVETGRRVVRARLHQTSTDEVTAGQDTTTSQWRLVVPFGTPVGVDDVVEAGGVTFTVVGEPYLARRASLWAQPHHLEVRLVEVHG
jgi:hypothetical protein